MSRVQLCIRRRQPGVVGWSFGAIAIAAACLSAPAFGFRDFEVRYETEARGEITMAANPVLTCTPSPGAECVDARRGTGARLNNQDHVMQYIDVDGDPATFDSSTATLQLPASSQVLHAALYWGGVTIDPLSPELAAPDPAKRGEVLLATPSSPTYNPITATHLDFTSNDNSPSARYQAYADVTSLIRAGGTGPYTVANLQVGGGETDGGWTLVVAYRDLTQPLRRLAIYDGLVRVGRSSSQEVTLGGFEVPSSPGLAPSARLGTVTYEGDLGVGGDDLYLDGRRLSDAANPLGNFFNSSISALGVRRSDKQPDYVNQLGYDSDLLEASDRFRPGQTEATLRFETDLDVFVPGVFTLALDTLPVAPPPPDRCDREPPSTLGLEHYMHYETLPTGAGAIAAANLASGNLVWHRLLEQNPGRGLASVANLTYNSYAPGCDYGWVGSGFSIAISGLTRINEPLRLDFDPDDPDPLAPRSIILTDPDATRHSFAANPDDPLVYDEPAAVNLRMRVFDPPQRPYDPANPPDPTDPDAIDPTDYPHTYAATRADGVTYYFDAAGYASEIVDRNGNTIRFLYQLRSTQVPAGCDRFEPGACEPRLSDVVDAAGVELLEKAAGRPLSDPETARLRRRSIHLNYHDGLLSDGAGSGRLAELRDHGGHVTRFTYGPEGQLAEVLEAAGTNAARRTEFRYDRAAGDIARPLAAPPLSAVIDPRGKSTRFGYEPAAPLDPADPAGATSTATPLRRLKTITDRRSNPLQFTYAGRLGEAGTEPAPASPAYQTTVRTRRNQRYSYQLDELLRPIAATSPLPATQKLVWDSDSNVIAITEAAGTPEKATSTMTYNPNGQLLTSDPAGPIGPTRIDYCNGAGNQIAPSGADAGGEFVSDPVALRLAAVPNRGGSALAGRTWRFEYDRPITESEPSADPCSTLTRGNQSALRDPLGDTARMAYDRDGQIRVERDQVGDTTRYRHYTDDGLPRRMLDARGKAWAFGYDRVGNLIETTDPRGVGPKRDGFESTLTYDALDRMISERTPIDSQQGRYATRHYRYDDNDNLLERVDATGAPTRFEYGPTDMRSAITNALGERSHYFYDPDDALIRTVLPKGQRTARRHDFTTNIRRDGAGRVVAVWQNAFESGSDRAKRLITSYAYDRRDNLIGVSDPRGNRAVGVKGAIANAAATKTRRLSRVYDKSDQLKASISDPGKLALTTSYRYDAGGRLSAEVSPRGNLPGARPTQYRSRYRYDRRDQLRLQIDPLGRTTRYRYRADGLVDSITSPRGVRTRGEGLSEDFTTHFDYYPTKELRRRSIPYAAGQYGSRPTNSRVRWQRNSVGDPVAIIDGRANKINNRFYDSGDLRQTDRPSWWSLDPASGSVTELGGSANAGRSDTGPMVPAGEGQGDFGAVARGQTPALMPLAGKTKFRYDNEMRLSSVKGTGRGMSTIERDPLGRVSKLTEPLQRQTERFITSSFKYDQNGNLSEQLDPLGNSTRYRYDGFDRMIEMRTPPSSDQAKRPRTRYELDPNGNLRREIAPGPGSENSRASRYAYDSLDRLTQATNPEGESTYYGYDAEGNRTVSISPRAPRRLLKRGLDSALARRAGGQLVGEVAKFATTSHYDSAGQLDRITAPQGITTRFRYDPNGNLTLTDAPGAQTDSGGEGDQGRVRFLTKVRYDGRDTPWVTQVATTDGELHHRQVTEYDQNGNLIRTVSGRALRRTAVPGDGRLALPEHRYDPSLIDTAIADKPSPKLAERAETRLRGATYEAEVHTYTPDDLPSQTYLAWGKRDRTDRRGYVSDLHRDRRGYITAIDSPHPYDLAPGAGPGQSPGHLERTSLSYFDPGWVRAISQPARLDPNEPLQSEIPDGQRALSFNYDRRGYQTRWESASKRKISRTYYPSGALATRSGQKGTGDAKTIRSSSYTYDSRGRLTTLTDTYPGSGGPLVTEISHDNAGRVKRVDQAEGWGEDGIDTAYAYDRSANVETLKANGRLSEGGKYLGGQISRYTYNPAERERSATVERADDSFETSSRWWPSGQLRRRVKPNGTVERRFYKGPGEISQMTRIASDGTEQKNIHYTYDQNANRTADERGTYSYNSRDQLTAWTRASDFPEDPGTSVSYRPDPTGSIVTSNDEASGAKTHNYYLADRLIRTEATTDALTTTTRYRYDGLGNLTKAIASAPGALSSTVRHRYDELSRPTATTNADGSTERYRYDGLDRRITKTTSDGTQTDYAYVGLSERVAREREAPRGSETTTTARFYDYSSSGERLGIQTANPGSAEPAKYTPYATDAQGSVEGLESPDGRIADSDRYAYDPYGNLENEDELSDEATDNPFRFQGFYFDEGAETYDMGARSYAPELGRFLSADVFESGAANLALAADPLTTDRYAFTAGNPISRVEWDGHHHCQSTAVCDRGSGLRGPDARGFRQAIHAMTWIPQQIGAAVAGQTVPLTMAQQASPALAAPVQAMAVSMGSPNLIRLFVSTIPDDEVDTYLALFADDPATLDRFVYELRQRRTEERFGTRPAEYYYPGAGLDPPTGNSTSIVAGPAQSLGGPIDAAGGAVHGGLGFHVFGNQDTGLYGAEQHAFEIASTVSGLGGLGKAVLRQGMKRVIRSEADDVVAAACSFPAGTPVLMANRTYKVIEGIEVGDWVLASDPETGKTIRRRVSALVGAHIGEEMVAITIGGETLATTVNHPFWSIDRGQWIEAGVLNDGELLRGVDGSPVEIEGVERLAYRDVVFNFTVRGLHTYYVGAGGEQVLVHNCVGLAAKGVPTIKPGSAGGPTAGKRFPQSVKDRVRAEDPTNTCVYCARPGTGTQVDHAIPRAQGGNALFENAQMSCPFCNASKGARDFPVNPPSEYFGLWPPPHWR